MRISDWSSDVCSSDLHQDVALARQFAAEITAGIGAQIDRDALLVPVDREEVGALASQAGRVPGAAVVAAVRILDLDHLGAEVGQHHGEIRAGEDAGDRKSTRLNSSH